MVISILQNLRRVKNISDVNTGRKTVLISKEELFLDLLKISRGSKILFNLVIGLTPQTIRSLLTVQIIYLERV